MGSVLVDEQRTWQRSQCLALAELRAAGLAVEPAGLARALREGIATRRPRVTQAGLLDFGADPALAQRVRARAGNADRPIADAAVALARLASRVPLVLVANQGLQARPLLERQDCIVTSRRCSSQWSWA